MMRLVSPPRIDVSAVRQFHKQKTEHQDPAHSFSRFLLHAVLVLVVLPTFSIFFVEMVLFVATVRQATQQFSRLCCDAVDAACVNLHAAIQSTARLLKIDTVSFFEQRHIVKVIDQGKVPGVRSVDLVVCGHLHPFFKVRQNRNSLHWCHCASSND